MNRTDVVLGVSNSTGLDMGVCDKVIKAFEKHVEVALKNKFKRIKMTHDEVIEGISKKTECSIDDCEKIYLSLNHTLDEGMSNKLRFIKRWKTNRLQKK